MDVRVPGMEVPRPLVASGGRSRVLVLTTFDFDEYAHVTFALAPVLFLLRINPPGGASPRHPGRRPRGRQLCIPAFSSRSPVLVERDALA